MELKTNNSLLRSSFKCILLLLVIVTNCRIESVEDGSQRSTGSRKGKASESAVGKTPASCSKSQFRCVINGTCISKSWICDGERDCEDESDEEDSRCVARTCSGDQFKCEKDHRCIPNRWRCDTHPDCTDGSDEAQCGAKECKKDRFKCLNGTTPCIPNWWKCDGEADCKDGSDEQNCKDHTCSNQHFTCGNGKCIYRQWRCDGDNDCGDESDEKGCVTTHPSGLRCRENEFKCHNGQCIRKVWVCDGEVDCADGSDEASSCKPKCDATKYKCGNGKCINRTWKCDGDNDCGDGSDEKDCKAQPYSCPNGEWMCIGNTKCINVTKVCDGNNDCGDNSDEGANCLDQTCKKRGCSHMCRPAPRGNGICYCRQGYKLKKDGVTCEDINECEIPGTCDQICVNTPGKFKCDCAHGYIFEPPKTCRFNDSMTPDLLFADIKNIRRYNLYNGEYEYLIKNLTRVVALDFDIRKGMFYYTDVTHNKIYSMHYASSDKTFSRPKPIVESGLAVPDGLAVDWITKNIYFAESSANRIDVVTSSGTYRTSLISIGLSSPRGIGLDPRDGYMFFTDWGNNPRIERAGMDGRNRTVIVNVKLGWPNGLTLDYVDRVVYWADARLDYIGAIHYNGSSRRTVVSGVKNVPHPFAITLFDDFLYFSDWTKHGIVKVNKFTGKETMLVQRNLTRPMDLHTYHRSRQPNASNPCASKAGKKNGGCEHLCVISIGAKRTCLCKTGYIIKPDGRTCRRVEKFLLFARSWEVRGISLDPNDMHDVATPVLGLSSAVGTDFDVKERYIYFTDVKIDKIGRAPINGSKDRKYIIETDLQNPDGIAVDWIGRNLYWTDAKVQGKPEIGVAKLDGRFRRPLITEGLGKPRAIVLHPEKGLLFYTDWLKPAKIGRANMDGAEHMLLVNGSNIGWPNGLSVDLVKNKLYWADAKTDRIERIGIDGTGRELLLRDVRHPFGLAVYGDFFYYSDWLDRHIRRVNNSNTSEVSIIRSGLSGVMELQIYDKDLQKGENKCSDTNCTHLCLARPDGFVCACGTNYTLDSDNITCVAKGMTTPPPDCGPDWFACASGRCIRARWRCDGDNDCGDNSDETEEACKSITCDPDSFRCNTNRCVPRSWKCDGDNDCRDGSDEKNCSSRTCTSTQFLCANNKCIHRRWTCDGDNDCGDRSDEKDCQNKTCSPNQFACDRRCISKSWRCDGEVDCRDKSDERGCAQKNCTLLGRFGCANGNCIPKIHKCDGDDDCGDGSDEKGCELCINGTCNIPCRNETEFTCGNGRCVEKRYLCDYFNDCGDNSDERNCSRLCEKNEFRCKNARCINKSWKCDGDDDCGDNSDEKQCTTTPAPFSCDLQRTEWLCPNTTTCIELAKLCNGRRDCPNGADEGPGCKYYECRTLNGGCSHQCTDGPNGVVCGCPAGLKLSNDSKTCEDINECLEFGSCSQTCQNVKGSFVCSCGEGYQLRRNKKTCSATGPEPYIYYSDRREIRRLELKTNNAESVITGLTNAIGIEFDWQEGMLYWSDVNDDKIERSYFNGSGRQVIVKTGLIAPEGIAIDWVARNIYWTDMRTDTIEAAKLDGSLRSIIISTGHEAPRAISVDPRVGYLFWTDWGSNPRVQRADMDGANRKSIVDRKIVWPNALTLDYENRLVYFMDARLDYLEAVRYDGSQRRTVVQARRFISHPFACTLFEDYVYFTDWSPARINRVGKFKGGSKRLIQERLTKPMDIQVVHPARQPKAKNYCSNHTCSHLCVLRPKGYSCRCPYGMHLKKDNKTCQDIQTVLLYAKRLEIRGISLDPNDTVDKITPITQLTNAIAVDFHFNQSYIYWSDVNRDSISRIFLNGTGRQAVIPAGIPSPDGLCIDWIAGNLYWTDTGKDMIEVARLDGRYRRVLISKNLDQPRAIVVHPEKGFLFWSDWGSKAKIEQARLDGSNRSVIINSSLGYPNGIVIDTKSDILYWCDAQLDKIEAYYLIDGKRIVVADKRQVAHPFGLSLFKNYIYWTDWGKRAIRRLNVQTNQTRDMRKNMLSLMGISVYDESRQKGTNPCAKDNGGCSHLCFYLGKGQTVCKCATGFTLTDDGKTCVGTKSFLLYTTTTEIHGIPFDPNDESESIVPILGLRSSYAVDYDYEDRLIFMVDDNQDKIFRCKTDGSEYRTIIDSGLKRPQGIAVDWVAKNIYWTDAETYLIEVSRYNGSDRLVLINDNLESPRSIVVYPSKGLMFWTDWGSRNPKIEQSRMDGSGRKVLVDKKILSSIGWPNGLTVDYETDTIYWLDAKNDSLFKMGLNGEDLQRLPGNFQLSHPYAVTVFENYLYWTDWTKQVIMKANKRNLREVTTMRKNIGSIRDIHAYDRKRQNGTNTCAINNGNCAQLCLATSATSHNCTCTTGKLGADKKSCVPVDSFLFFAKRNEIITLHLDPKRRASPHPPIKALKNAIGIDFHYETERIFYSDIFSNEIGSIFLNGTGKDVIASKLRTPDGIAYDWISDKIYWTDAHENTISRISVSVNRTREILIRHGLDEPRAIALSPCDSLLYWTDWGSRPYIRRSTMEGLRPETIIQTGLGWPNGLTLDYEESKIYWADARVDRIEVANLDGSDRRVIVTLIPHVFGISLYGQYIYWTDWVARSVKRADKYNGGNPVSLMDGLDAQPMDIKVFAKERQNCAITPCFDNGGCSHTCIVKEGKKLCTCPDGFKLIKNFRCVPQNSSCKEEQFTCDDGNCRDSMYMCDGDNDCPDKSDESALVCRSHKCPEHRVACVSTGKCIPKQWQCDHEADCDDGSDEENCEHPTCSPSEFQCDNGRCILKAFKCDGENDCRDFSDEKVCPRTTCRPGSFNCNSTATCIRKSWVCDGEDDCGDGSDEADVVCKNITCPPGKFPCSNGRCIPSRWHCDKDNDCGDNSDEPANCNNANRTCLPTQLKCDNGSCVSKNFICDGDQDCLDGSDEDTERHKCEKRTCDPSDFACVNTSRCVPMSYKCDGDNDCGDGSDEHPREGCPVRPCAKYQFRCGNGICIRSTWRCDKEDDCGDLSDEANCPNGTCGPNHFTCKNGQCVPRVVRCDGGKDCVDGSDEAPEICSMSTPKPPCREGHIACSDNKGCISKTQICDKHPDCPDESDEKGCGINECADKRLHGCAQRCRDLPRGFQCYCNPGFKLIADGKTCTDIDECSVYSLNNCSQYCINTIGSFKCQCAKGYSWEIQSQTCKIAGDFPNPYLLFSNRHYIRTLTLDNQIYDVLQRDRRDAYAVDFDWRDQMYYWTDRIPGEVRRAKFNGNGSSTLVARTGLPSPFDLVVEWVSRNLYFSDRVRDSIFVCQLNGFYRKTLLTDSLNRPRALAVYPEGGWLYFTVWGENASISRIGLDGTNRSVIVSGKVAWPRGIAIDYITKMMYWTDAHLHRLEMARLDGSRRRILRSEANSHLFGITVFEQYIYWTNWRSSAVSRVNRLTGLDKLILRRSRDRTMGIKVVHPLRQQNISSPCNIDRGNCTNLCLLSPGGGYRCACPDNFNLAADGRTCLSNCSAGEFECKNYKCIPRLWKCDAEDDCGDGSDEGAFCPVRKCRPGQFQCDNTNCTSPFWICDGEDDCGDRSDERNCEARKCFSFQFRCANHRCIFANRVCNGNGDCKDSSDEWNCTKKETSCSQDKFACDSGRCITSYWKCDGDNDCGDASDEKPALCQDRTCQPNSFKCNNSRCILRRYLCDGDNDCHDNSDEAPDKCVGHTCRANQFHCNNNRCIPKRWKCDFDNDCGDGSDEDSCPSKPCKDREEFGCGNGRCINTRWHCDQDDDCGDGSDERGCTNTTCTSEQFACKSGHCISQRWRCDGEPDCRDGSDEEDCASKHTQCLSDQYRCANNICIKRSWVCDGDNDCLDSSDEDPKKCNSSNWCNSEVQFRCKNGFCIRSWKKCDGVKHCSDGSDEAHCSLCRPDQFKCEDSRCIDKKLVCNGIKDCSESEDEIGCEQNNTTSCQVGNGGCKHLCVQLKRGHICKCRDGFEVTKDGKGCRDINECQIFGKCSQLCENYIGGYKCKCAKGYFPDPNNKRCKAEGDPGFVVLPVEGELRRIMPSGREYRYNVFISNTSKVHSLDFHVDKRLLFVGDRNTKAIKGYSLSTTLLRLNSLNSNTRKRRESEPMYTELPLNIKGTDPSAIAVDWVGNNIYWVNANSRKASIMMADLKGNNVRVLITKDLYRPQSIVLDPINGNMYWTDWGASPAIWRAKMDGNEATRFITERLEWPTGLAVDLPAKRLYWADTKQHQISAINFDGTGRHTVMTFANKSVHHPFSIDVFEDDIYGLTWRTGKLFRLNKFGKGKVKVIDKDLPMATSTGIKMFQQNRQQAPKDLQNLCDPNPCRELCVVVGRQRKCVCTPSSLQNDPSCQEAINRTCDTSKCNNHGSCHQIGRTIKCSCEVGFTGEFCEKRLESCHKYCKNGGTCSLLNGHPKCRCAPGFNGPRCEDSVDRCVGYCKNGGNCMYRGQQLFCKCPDGFNGQKCEISLCEKKKCPEHSKCLIQNKKAKCKCDNGYVPVNETYCEDICMNHICPPGYKCVINSVGEADCRCNTNDCRTKPVTGTGQQSSTKAVQVAVPIVILLVVVLVIVLVILWKKRSRYRFNPGAAFDVKVENPTFGYSAFQEEEPYHENEGFLSEPKHPNNFANPMYDDLYNKRTSLKSSSEDGSDISPDHPMLNHEDYDEKKKLVDDDFWVGRHSNEA